MAVVIQSVMVSIALATDFLLPPRINRTLESKCNSFGYYCLTCVWGEDGIQCWLIVETRFCSWIHGKACFHVHPAAVAPLCGGVVHMSLSVCVCVCVWERERERERERVREVEFSVLPCDGESRSEFLGISSTSARSSPSSLRQILTSASVKIIAWKIIQKLATPFHIPRHNGKM